MKKMKYTQYMRPIYKTYRKQIANGKSKYFFKLGITLNVNE